MKRLLLLLACLRLLVPSAYATGTTTVTGSIKYPDGTPFNGSLQIQMVRGGVRDNCNGGRVIPTAPIRIQVVNGTVQGGSVALTTSECMAPYSAYYIRLFNSTGALIADDNWIGGATTTSLATLDVGQLFLASMLFAAPPSPITINIPKAIISTPGQSQLITQPAGTVFGISGGAWEFQKIGSAPTVSGANNVRIYTDGTSLLASINGGSYLPIAAAGAGSITGSGTGGNLTKWSSATVVTNSIISDNGSTATVTGALATTGNVGIGLSPTYRLDVSAGANGTQSRFGNNGESFVSTFNGAAYVSSQASVSSAGVWTARVSGAGGSGAAILQLNDDGSFSIDGNSGLTNGNTFSPSQHLSLSAAGAFVIPSNVTHAMGGTVNVSTLFSIGQGTTWTGATSNSSGAVLINPTINPGANNSEYGIVLQPTFQKAGSGTHPNFFGETIGIGFATGAAALTDAIGLDISGFSAPATTTNATALRVGAGGGATGSNWSIHSTGGVVQFDAPGPHSIGGNANGNIQLQLTGTFALTTAGEGLGIHTNLGGSAGASVNAFYLSPVLTKAGSGNHPLLSGQQVVLTFGAGAATVTDTVGIDIATYTAPASTTNATGIRVAQPSSATNNYAATFLTAGGAQMVRIQDVASNYSLVVQNQQASAGTSLGLAVLAGTNTSDTSFQVSNQANSLSFLKVSGAGNVTFPQSVSHAIGGTIDSRAEILLTGAFTGSADTYGLWQTSSLTGVAGNNIFGFISAPVLVEAGSGTHGLLAAIHIAPTITNGAATTTDVAGLNVASITAATGTTNATGIKVQATTGATNNYAINVTTGVIHQASVAVGSLPTCNAGNSGSLIVVTDANATTFNSVVANGGGNVVMVLCDGTNWRIH